MNWPDGKAGITMLDQAMRRQLGYVVVILTIFMSAVRPSIAEAPTLAMLGDIGDPFDASENLTVANGVAEGPAALAAGRRGSKQLQYMCLAQAIYFEARGEPIEGQVAVAQVVMNRLSDRRFPRTICGVVYQNETRRHRCQFSFACDGKSDTPRNGIAWMRAKYIASLALNGMLENVVGDSTHYHATYTNPVWASDLDPTIVVGRHKFYREAS
jgi:spore germination cell wall hydrolase CwlJ-like protein